MTTEIETKRVGLVTPSLPHMSQKLISQPHGGWLLAPAQRALRTSLNESKKRRVSGLLWISRSPATATPIVNRFVTKCFAMLQRRNSWMNGARAGSARAAQELERVARVELTPS